MILRHESHIADILWDEDKPGIAEAFEPEEHIPPKGWYWLRWGFVMGVSAVLMRRKRWNAQHYRKTGTFILHGLN